MSGTVLERPSKSKDRAKAAEPVREGRQNSSTIRAECTNAAEIEGVNENNSRQFSELRTTMAYHASTEFAAAPAKNRIIKGLTTVTNTGTDQITGLLRLCGYSGGAISLVMLMFGSVSPLLGGLFILSVLLMFCGS